MMNISESIICSHIAFVEIGFMGYPDNGINK